MTHAILRRATVRKILIRFAFMALTSGFAGAAAAQGSAGAAPPVYGSAWAASQQMAQGTLTRTVESGTASAGVKPGGDARVSSKTIASK